MAAKNKVIAGDYLKADVDVSWGNLIIKKGFTKVKITKETVEHYELADQDSKKSGKSGLLRGLVGTAAGALVAAPVAIVGGAAGILSAKSKGEYTIAIQFKDGKRSLLNVDDKIYKSLMKNLF